MDYEKLLGDFDNTIIRLSRTYHIKPLEPEDLAQELRIHLWKKREHYNPQKKYSDWAYIVSRNHIKNLAKYYSRQKRNEDQKVSLDELREQGYEY